MIKPGKGVASNKTPGRSHSIERNTMNDYETEDNDIGDNDSINHDGESECEDLSDKDKGYDDKDDYNYMSEYEEASDCKSGGKDSEDTDITDKANRKVSHSSNDKSCKTYNDKDENDRVNEYEEASEYENSDDGSEDTDIADYTAWDVTHTTGMGENAVYWNVTDDGVTDCKDEETLLNNLEKDGAVTEEIMEIDYFLKDPDNG